MNYAIKKVDFEISNFSSISTNIINSNLFAHTNLQYQKFKIINYIGKGTVGQVYLIESNGKEYIIKISNSECIEDLIEEVNFIESLFKKHNITHPSYPLYFGPFKNLKAVGVIYPYFGFYNLEKLKSIKYKISFAHNISIIKQLITQMNEFKNILHCDIKPSNIVVDVSENVITATIIDFGLIKEKTNKSHIISTNYITSPESLLTLIDFSDCISVKNDLSIDKHDYFGLFCVIINLFIGRNFWNFLAKYLIDINFNSAQLLKQSASIIFVYVWFRFTYKKKDQITNTNLLNLINKIEKIYPNIEVKKFLTYEDFFTLYIEPNIDLDTIEKANINNLKNFTKQIIQFEYSNRPELDKLAQDNFLL